MIEHNDLQFSFDVRKLILIQSDSQNYLLLKNTCKDTMGSKQKHNIRGFFEPKSPFTTCAGTSMELATKGEMSRWQKVDERGDFEGRNHREVSWMYTIHGIFTYINESFLC